MVAAFGAPSYSAEVCKEECGVAGPSPTWGFESLRPYYARTSRREWEANGGRPPKERDAKGSVGFAGIRRDRSDGLDWLGRLWTTRICHRFRGINHGPILPRLLRSAWRRGHEPSVTARALDLGQTETILLPLSKSLTWFPMKIATRSRSNSPLRIFEANGYLYASGQLKISVAMMFCL